MNYYIYFYIQVILKISLIIITINTKKDYIYNMYQTI